MRRHACGLPLCSLAEWLLERWTWGAMSAHMVQEAAYQAWLDGLRHESIVMLASCGTWGAHTGNIQRDIERRVLPTLTYTPEPYVHGIPALDPRGDRTHTCTASASVLLPHEWIAVMSANAPDAFDRAFGVPLVPDFWVHQDMHDPKLMLHQDLDNTCVPLWLHGDGAEYQNRDSLTIVSFSGVLGTGCTKDRKLYLTSWSKECTAMTRHGFQADTWRDGLWPILVWSFKACYEGRFPSTDHIGRPFPEGSQRAQLAGAPLCSGDIPFRFYVYGVLGDLDYFSKDLDLPFHNNHRPCWFCDADCTDNPWNDFRARASWQDRTVQDVQGNPRSRHPIWSIPGVHELCTMLDVLHVVDQGVASHVIGNVLHTIIYDELCTRQRGAHRVTAKEALGTLWQEIQAIYTQLGIEHRLHNLKLSMFMHDPAAPYAHFPCLSSVKAADTRHLVPVVCELCRRYYDPTVERTQHRFFCAKRLTQFYVHLKHEGTHLPLAAGQAILADARACLAHYGWLAADANARGKLQWSIVPKQHFFAHLAAQGRFINPRRSWTYMDEDFMNVIVTIARSSNSVGTIRVNDAVVLKYRAAMQLRMQQGLEG